MELLDVAPVIIGGGVVLKLTDVALKDRRKKKQKKSKKREMKKLKKVI